jgi:transcriptional regulator with XRE-family HTH domain
MPGQFADDEKCQDFVQTLKNMRDGYGWTQEETARRAFLSPGTIGNIESFIRAPMVDHGIGLDRAFQVVNVFAAKARAIRGEGMPPEFRKFSEIEAIATALHVADHSFIPGLLQTEDYAREVLRTRLGRKPKEVEQLVATRMMRQDVITPGDDRDPALLCALIDESALTRPMAPAPAMHAQLMRLLEVSYWHNVRIGVIPYRAGGHSGLLGAFTIATQPGDRETVAWLQHAAGGHATADPVAVATVMVAFEALQMEALPVGDSREFIARVADTLWNGSAPAGARALTVATMVPSV